jgi:hypothetical protein
MTKLKSAYDNICSEEHQGISCLRLFGNAMAGLFGVVLPCCGNSVRAIAAHSWHTGCNLSQSAFAFSSTRIKSLTKCNTISVTPSAAVKADSIFTFHDDGENKMGFSA